MSLNNNPGLVIFRIHHQKIILNQMADGFGRREKISHSQIGGQGNQTMEVDVLAEQKIML